MIKYKIKKQLDKYGMLAYLKRSKLWKYKNRKNYESFRSKSPAVLEYLIKIFDENAINVWPGDGTLLGLIRDGGPIKGDLDIDIGVFYSSEVQKKIRSLLIDHGFALYFEATHLDEYRLFEKFYFNEVPIDIYYFFDRNGKMCAFDLDQDGNMNAEECLSRMQDIKVYRNEFSYFELNKKVINNIEFNIPVDIHNYLIEHYGHSYTVPDPSWHNNKRKNRYVDNTIILKTKKF